MNVPLKIGELARRAQCPAETIRYYEREGLLPRPARSSGNYRIYGHEHLERLAFIRNCRSLDMTLNEIRQLLRVRDLPRNRHAAHDLLDSHIAHVATRIAELRGLERQLKALRQQCASSGEEDACRVLDGLARPRRRRGGSSTGHVRGAHRG